MGFTTRFILELPRWWYWVVVAHLIFVAQARWPIRRPFLLRNTLIHIVFAMIASILYVALIMVSTHYLLPVLVALDMKGAATITDRLQPAGLLRGLAMGWPGFISTPLPILLYASIMVLNDAVTYQKELHERRIRERELEASVARSQLESLRLQLHPHFLFNTLTRCRG